MSWIQENKVPAAILGLTGAGVVGLGVVLFNAWSAASAAQESYDAVNLSLANLKSAPLGPTPENLACWETTIAILKRLLSADHAPRLPLEWRSFSGVLALKAQCADARPWSRWLSKFRRFSRLEPAKGLTQARESRMLASPAIDG